jgi:hypothetical protein
LRGYTDSLLKSSGMGEKSSGTEVRNRNERLLRIKRPQPTPKADRGQENLGRCSHDGAENGKYFLTQ